MADSSKVHEGCLLGVGNPLLDISANVDKSLLEKYDLKLATTTLAEEKHLPLYKELVANYAVEYIAGGATQNAMRVAQWILRKQPKSVSYMGSVGNDDFCQRLRECAAAVGLHVNYQVNEGIDTGCCAVLITDRERTLLPNLSAANHFKITHLETDESKRLLNLAEMIYIECYFLTVSTESTLKVAKYAAENNKIFSMNLAATFLLEFFLQNVLSVLPYMDYVFGNESEAASLGKALGWGEDVIEVAKKAQAYEKVNGQRQRVVVFTRGADSTVVCTGDGQIHLFPVIKCTDEDIVDLNGAGDSFVGGFLSQLVQHAPLERCIAAGNYAAHEVIKRSGCTLPAEPEAQWFQ